MCLSCGCCSIISVSRRSEPSGPPTSTTPSANNNSGRIATTAYVDSALSAGAKIVVSDVPPTGLAAPDGALWWESDKGMLYLRYNDGNTVQWVPAVPVPDTSMFVVKAEATTAFAASGMQINGGMEVDQPNNGASYGINTGAVAGHLIDGFRYEKTGTSVLTAQQVNSSIPNYTKSLKLTVSTAQITLGTDVVDVIHTIEGFRISNLGWGTASAKPLTIGVWIKSSVAGVIPFNIRNHDLSAAVTVNTPALVANTATWVVLNVPAQTTGLWKTDNTVGIYVRIRVASAANMNLVATNGSTLEMTGLVILPDTLTIAAAQSPLLMRPYDVELQLCQRYWQGFTSVIVESAAVYQTTYFPVAMRVPPTVGGGAGTAGFVVATNPDGKAISFYNASRVGGITLTFDARL